MRHLTVLMLALPSFCTPVLAEDAPSDPYKRLAAWQACNASCDTASLRQRADGVDPAKAERNLRICRMDCSSGFNRAEAAKAP